MTTITIRFQNNYGTHVAYPVCNTAKLLCDLTRKQTFVPSDLDMIKQLGFAIEVQSERKVPAGWDFVVA